MSNPSGATELGTVVNGAARPPAAARPRAAKVARSRGDVGGALLLIAPLALFMLVFFVVPIASLLTRAAWDPSVAVAFPGTARALANWDGASAPPAAAFGALAADIVAADDAGTLGDATERLNRDAPGMRLLLLRARRHLDHLAEGAGQPAAPRDPAAVKADLIQYDPHWGEAPAWRAIARAVRPLTAAYALRAIDSHQDAEGRIAMLPPDRRVFLPILGRTFGISAVVTALVVVFGFPLTYWLSRLPAARQRLMLMAVLIPFWTSILVRIAAWMVVLPREGVINRLALAMHIVDTPLDLIYNRTGVVISMVHILIPFMVLPLLAVMRGIPLTYQRAAVSLGSHPFGAFWRVYAPLTAPGVAAGALLVFVSALGYYIAPALLGGAGDQMLSYYIAWFTNTSINWGLAAALSALLLIATALLFVVYRMLMAGRRHLFGEAATS
ncbi:putative spermidine/putrescine transport system permease protein [Paraburkholderia unamae]|uniref:ABC transporter permease n=1 Tax=Paraburkholderia unamae TaxID=219649 RepID=UPI000DC59798|nr:ABC transporter permease [Paraburkholderia unamae]RAR57507.1 putative spermidine/putrescine transport system permease protein [Paraburkholderia unamae]